MKNLLTLLLLSLCSIAHGQDHKALIIKARTLYDSKEYAQSVVAYKESFKLSQKSRIDLYNAARSAALAGEEQLAFQWLNLSFKNYHLNMGANLRRLKADTAFIALHDSKKWNKLVAPMQKEVDQIEANYNKPLQAELLQMDSNSRNYMHQIEETKKKYGTDSKEYQDLWTAGHVTDSINLIKVKAILDKYGWVGRDKVGEQANQMLFYVLLKADLATQQKYLPMMRESFQDRKTSGELLAILEDEVAIAQGKRQIYGTRTTKDKETGEFYVFPLEDPDNVDLRRAELAIEPLAKRVKNWNPEEYKKQLPEIEARQKAKN